MTDFDRDDVLDAVKGCLVLLMVLYHWLNYFIGLQWAGYPYLRFLTPSFLFITGFIVGRVYLAKYSGDHWSLARRTWLRAGKLLALFAVLNLADTVVALRTFDPSSLAAAWPAARVEGVLLHGHGGAAFVILVSIASFLLLTPALAGAIAITGLPAWLLALVALGAAVAGSMTAHGYAQFEMVAIGLAGSGWGALGKAGTQRVVSHAWQLAILYAAHVAVIARWNAPFVLQVVAVPLNVAALYASVSWLGAEGRPFQALVLLGRYSLFAYVAQILILQVLRRLARPPYAPVELVVTLAVAIVTTWVAVAGVSWLRRRSPLTDGAYRAVFA